VGEIGKRSSGFFRSTQGKMEEKGCQYSLINNKSALSAAFLKMRRENEPECAMK